MKYSLTRRAAEFAVNLKYDLIPDEVIKIVKYSFVDTLSVGILGSEEPVFIKARKYVNEDPTRGSSFVFGSGHNYKLEDSALLNGIACHALDYDDVHEAMHGHPSAVLWATILGFADKKNFSDEKAITAYVAAAEIMGKLGGGIDRSHYSAGWHATSTLGVIGAAISSSIIMGLTMDEIANSIGLACSFASGLRCNFGYMAKCVHVGRAAQDGIIASKMSQNGVTSSKSAIEDNCGFIQCFSKESIEYTANLFESLGKVWALQEPGLKTKYYPCCAATHIAVLAAMDIYSEHGSLLPDKIESIICRCKPWQPTVLRYPNPSTPVEAKFSMQYCVARMLLYGSLTIDSFSEDAISDRIVRELMNKIKMVAVSTESYQTLPTIEICLVNGIRILGKKEYAIGHSLNPMTIRQREEKLRMCIGDKLTGNQIENILDFAKQSQTQRTIKFILKEISYKIKEEL